MLAKGCACDNEEAVFRKAGNREVTFNAAAFVERLGVNDRADGLVNFIRADGVEEVQRAGTAHFKFVE